MAEGARTAFGAVNSENYQFSNEAARHRIIIASSVCPPS